MFQISAIQRLILGLVVMLNLEVTLGAQGSNIQQLKDADPYGFVLTLTAVGVVFTVLTLLIVFFKSIGKLMFSFAQRDKQKDTQIATPPSAQSRDKELAVAISLALASNKANLDGAVAACIALSLMDYTNSLHDHESYKLTIRSRATQWNNHQYSLRKHPY